MQLPCRREAKYLCGHRSRRPRSLASCRSALVAHASSVPAWASAHALEFGLLQTCRSLGSAHTWLTLARAGERPQVRSGALDLAPPGLAPPIAWLGNVRHKTRWRNRRGISRGSERKWFCTKSRRTQKAWAEAHASTLKRAPRGNGKRPNSRAWASAHAAGALAAPLEKRRYGLEQRLVFRPWRFRAECRGRPEGRA